jgi:Sulfotransferase family
MGFTRHHGRELSEIKAHTHELEQRTHEWTGKLARIEQAQDDALGRERHTPIIVFLHIPKTAGKTVVTMFNSAYPKGSVRDAGNYFRNPDKTLGKIARPRKQRGRVLAGHVPYGVLRERLPADARYLTFLREPVDRVLSQYWRHIRRQDPARAGIVKQRPGARVKAESLEQALVEMSLPRVNNLATRFLCSDPAPLGRLPASALDEAKANLQGLEFVGIQERFEQSMVLLQRAFGLGLVPYEDRHVSSDRPAVHELPHDQRALIEEHNQFDAELYRFGLTLFEDAVADAGAGLQTGIDALRAKNAAGGDAQ